tara:strand:+ start:18 stop:1304 length:1287 start_codon:yes stop_codon:yes gene_type:complete
MEIKMKDWPADKIKRKKVDALIPYARNARTHSDEQVAQLAASIKEWGWTTPVLVDEDGEIIAGHGRVMAARKLGIEEVPTMTATGWTKAQKQAYVLADNQLPQNAGWDMDLLSVEMKDLDAEGFDLSLIGFGDDMLANMLVDKTAGLTDENAVPDVPETPVTVEGDVWLLGDHRLMCGDSTSIDAVEKLMNGQKADMVFTDPPYGMSYGGGRAGKIGSNDGTVKKHGVILGDDKTGDNLIGLVQEAMASAVGVSKSESAKYVCFSWRTYTEFEAAMLDCGLKPSACIVWDKKSIGLGNANYRPQHEFIFYVKGGAWYGDKAQSDVWYSSRGSTGDYVHPTQKPVELIERAVTNSSKGGDVILDVFGGSGTTMIAAEKNGRHSRLMELEPKYCDVIVKRWCEFTGKDATLEANGKSFSVLEKGLEADAA